MSARSGSAESVVLPVPDSPKKSAVSPCAADVGRAVHRQHALLRHEVVHDREHRLLELTGVARAADEDHALGEVQDDERAGARAVARRVGLELRRVQHREVRVERRQLALRQGG